MTSATTDPRYEPTLAHLTTAALIAYGPALRLALAYSEDPSQEQLDILHFVARDVGLELLTLVRAAAFLPAELPADARPTPVLPLARELAESLTVLGAIRDAESALHVPVTSLADIDELYDDAARAWLGQHVEDLPERQTEASAQ